MIDPLVLSPLEDWTGGLWQILWANWEWHSIGFVDRCRRLSSAVYFYSEVNVHWRVGEMEKPMLLKAMKAVSRLLGLTECFADASSSDLLLQGSQDYIHKASICSPLKSINMHRSAPVEWSLSQYKAFSVALYRDIQFTYKHLHWIWNEKAIPSELFCCYLWAFCNLLLILKLLEGTADWAMPYLCPLWGIHSSCVW